MANFYKLEFNFLVQLTIFFNFQFTNNNNFLKKKKQR